MIPNHTTSRVEPEGPAAFSTIPLPPLLPMSEATSAALSSLGPPPPVRIGKPPKLASSPGFRSHLALPGLTESCRLSVAGHVLLPEKGFISSAHGLWTGWNRGIGGRGGMDPRGSDRPAPSSPRPPGRPTRGVRGARSSGGLSGASLYRGDGSPRTRATSRPAPDLAFRGLRGLRPSARESSRSGHRPSSPGAPLPRQVRQRRSASSEARAGCGWRPRRAPRPGPPRSRRSVSMMYQKSVPMAAAKHEAERAGQRRRAPASAPRCTRIAEPRPRLPPAAPRARSSRARFWGQNWVLGDLDPSHPPLAPPLSPSPAGWDCTASPLRPHHDLNPHLNRHSQPGAPFRSRSSMARRPPTIPVRTPLASQLFAALPGVCRSSQPCPATPPPTPAQGVCPPTPFPQLWAQWTRSPLCAAEHRETGGVVRGAEGTVFPQRG